jgi:UDP-glucose 4-epimerase
LNVLVIGGAGYIGSHMVKMLGQQGCNVTTLDDLSSGHRDAVLCGDFVQGSFGDHALLDDLLAGGFDAAMHFASFIQVGESVQHPDKYYRNNVTYTLGLLDAMRAHGVNKFIFSSTAATFGEPQYIPMDERHPQQPINPYGRTKLMVEQALADYDRMGSSRFACVTSMLRALTPKGGWVNGMTRKRI